MEGEEEQQEKRLGKRSSLSVLVAPFLPLESVRKWLMRRRKRRKRKKWKRRFTNDEEEGLSEGCDDRLVVFSSSIVMKERIEALFFRLK